MRKLIFILVFVMLSNCVDAYEIDSHLNQTIVSPTSKESIGYLTLSPETNEIVSDMSFIVTGTPFTYSFEPNTIPLLDSPSNVSIRVFVPSGISPSSYTATINILSNLTTKVITTPIIVPEVTLWNLSNASFSLSMSNQESTNISVSIANSGNMNVPLTLRVSGDGANLTKVDNSLMLFKGTQEVLNIKLLIPREQNFGGYAAVINLSNENNLSDWRTIDISISVSDNLPPEIIEIDAKNIQATKWLNISVSVRENVEISRVWLNLTYEYYYNESNSTVGLGDIKITTYKTNRSLASAEMTFKDGYYYYQLEETYRIGDYFVNIQANDTSNNIVKNITRFSVLPLQSIYFSDTINLEPSKRPRSHLLTVFYHTNIELFLNDFVYVGNYSVEIIFPDETKKVMDKIGDSVIIHDKGNYSIRFRGDKVDDEFAHGEIGISPPSLHIPINNITFTLTFVNYSLAEPFKMQFGDEIWDCSPFEGDTYAESYVECIVKLPPDTDEENLNVIFTSDQWNEYKNAQQIALGEKDNRIGNLSGWNSILSILLLSTVIVSIYYWKIYPYIDWGEIGQ